MEKISNEIKFTRTVLGEPVFIHSKNDKTSFDFIKPLIWNSKDLRIVADYLDNNPDCLIIKCD